MMPWRFGAAFRHVAEKGIFLPATLLVGETFRDALHRGRLGIEGTADDRHVGQPAVTSLGPPPYRYCGEWRLWLPGG